MLPVKESYIWLLLSQDPLGYRMRERVKVNVDLEQNGNKGREPESVLPESRKLVKDSIALWQTNKKRFRVLANGFFLFGDFILFGVRK